MFPQCLCQGAFQGAAAASFVEGGSPQPQPIFSLPWPRHAKRCLTLVASARLGHFHTSYLNRSLQSCQGALIMSSPASRSFDVPLARTPSRGSQGSATPGTSARSSRTALSDKYLLGEELGRGAFGQVTCSCLPRRRRDGAVGLQHDVTLTSQYSVLVRSVCAARPLFTRAHYKVVCRPIVVLLCGSLRHATLQVVGRSRRAARVAYSVT